MTGKVQMKKYRVQPQQKINLKEWDPDDSGGFELTKSERKIKIKQLNEDLERLQELLYAEGKQKLLIILQGMDAAGKDGTIRHVFEGVNPQGVKVASFKVPSEEELAHDYLWRIHEQVPAKGQITIFNRSHYEDVLVVRVKELVPKEIWQRRYEHINAFEKMLADEGVTILKFFLHIDQKEQKERLEARRDIPEKQWKFNPNDLKERKLWDQYQKAYEDVLRKTSTSWAPWYIVPANRKWYRNLIIATTLVDTLKKLNMQYPDSIENIMEFEVE
jgi:PPK2 family polyphosphate:nucleotide phosphotransferase